MAKVGCGSSHLAICQELEANGCASGVRGVRLILRRDRPAEGGSRFVAAAVCGPRGGGWARMRFGDWWRVRVMEVAGALRERVERGALRG